MRSLTALIHREFLEHRGAFFYAPLGLLGVLLLGTALSIAGNRFQIPGVVGAPTALRVYEFGVVVVSQLWWWYLLVTLFFYYADAFSADRRNNAMLFWKSMPVSDLTMLSSKMLAGLLVFPAIIFVVLLASGVALYVVIALGVLVMPGFTLPTPLAAITSLYDIGRFALVEFVLGILWFAPFLAWVGALSTVFRRWSIPLSFLIPGVLALLENAAFYGVVPQGGYIYGYLWHRLQFGPPSEIWFMAMMAGPTNVDLLQAALIDRIDWLQLAGGLVVAAVLVYIASLYRRRGVAA
jgi:ABC-2 type transport system permease protein